MRPANPAIALLLESKARVGRVAELHFMKTSCIILFALLLVGCTSTHQTASLTADQAKAVAIRLANEKAAATYHSETFHDGQPPGIDGQALTAALSSGHSMYELFARGAMQRSHLSDLSRSLVPAILVLTVALALWTFGLWRRQTKS
jgi:hypothetical protein